SINIYPFVKSILHSISTTYLPINISNGDFEKLIIAGAEERIESDIVFDNDYYPTSNAISNFKNLFLKKDIIAYEYGEHAYPMWETLKVARQKNDKNLVLKIKESFDNAFLNNDAIKINKVDQSIYGCVAIELFK